jgi:hypothetical protein
MSYAVHIKIKRNVLSEIEMACLNMNFSYVGKDKDYHTYRKNDVDILIKIGNEIEIFIVVPWKGDWKQIYEPAMILLKRFGGKIDGDGIERSLPERDEWLKRMEKDGCLD